jgi:hypothetical protein
MDEMIDATGAPFALHRAAASRTWRAPGVHPSSMARGGRFNGECHPIFARILAMWQRLRCWQWPLLAEQAVAERPFLG